MKKLITIFMFGVFVVAIAVTANAQMMTQGEAVKDDHTAKEEAEGKAIWEKLQAKQAACADLSDGDFGALGEYFMGQMMGDAHPAMNQMMIQMMGEDGEEQIHIVMGKRLSNCDAEAAFPVGGGGWMPMMNMMWGGWSSSSGYNQYMNPMTGFGMLGFFGGLFMILWWVLIIAAIVALVKWLAYSFKGGAPAEKSALDILKERYARGEVDKKEFEEKKKELMQ